MESDQETKPISFCGSSLEDLRDFPQDAKRDSGYQLSRVQQGEDPSDWKPLKRVGAGAMEIRIWDDTGTYRIIYVAKFKDAVYVLHAFKKTTEETSDKDINIAKQRYKDLQK